jgi:hypothetical protein
MFALKFFIDFFLIIIQLNFSVQSVHFGDGDDLANDIETVPPTSIDQMMGLIKSSKQRDLSKWTFAEHFEPKLFVQVLQEAAYTHPFIDTYYNRRDHSIMLVLSNPFNENTLKNKQSSSFRLHSNVGFR